MPSNRTAKEQLGVDLEEPEVQAPPEPEPEPEAERPEWLPEKFKSPEEYVDSYKNLENEIRVREENHQRELAEMREMFAQFQSQEQPPPPPQQGDYRQVVEQLQAAYDNDPIGTIMFLANQAADQRMQAYQQSQQPVYSQQQQLQGELIAASASRVLEAKYDDWHEYENTVGSLIEANPGLLPETALQSLEATANALEAVYKIAKYEDLTKAVATNGTQQSSDAMKRQAQTMSGTAGRPPQQTDVDDKMAQLMAATRASSYSAFRGGR